MKNYNGFYGDYYVDVSERGLVMHLPKQDSGARQSGRTTCIVNTVIDYMFSHKGGTPIYFADHTLTNEQARKHIVERLVTQLHERFGLAVNVSFQKSYSSILTDAENGQVFITYERMEFPMSPSPNYLLVRLVYPKYILRVPVKPLIRKRGMVTKT